MDIVFQPKQAEVFQSTATEILYGGAAGGGKSYLLRGVAITYAHAIPGLQAYVFRRTFPDLVQNHMTGAYGFPALLADWVQSGFVKINYSDLAIKFRNGPTGGFDGGSAIYLKHCQYEKDVMDYKGAEFHLLLMDELTTFTDTIYRFLRGRVRLAGLKVPEQYKAVIPRIICGTNPGDVGHQFVKATFIESAPEGEIWRTPKDEGGMLRQFIRALLSDNAKLMEDDPTYIDRLEGLGDAALVRGMAKGDWNIVAGGAFDDVWNPDRHIIKPFKIPASWRIDRSYDWGESKPSCCLWWAESDGTPVMVWSEGEDGVAVVKPVTFAPGTLFAIEEYYTCVEGKPNQGTRATVAEQAKAIRAIDMTFDPPGEDGRVSAGPADTMIWNSANHTVSFYDEFLMYGVDWTEADKSPGTRMDGLSKLRAMFKQSLNPMHEGPGLYVFAGKCPNFVRTIPTLPRDKNNPDDINSHAEDHAYDTARYKVLAKPQNVVFARLVGV